MSMLDVRESGAGTESPLRPSAASSDFTQRMERHLRIIRVRTLILVIVSVTAAAYFARDFLLPVVLAFLLALTFSPVVRQLQRRSIPAGASAFLLVVMMVAALAVGIGFLSGPISHWLDAAPEIGRQLSSKLSVLRPQVEAAVEASKQVENLAASSSSPDVQKVVIDQPGLISRAADTLASTVTSMGLMLVLLLFLLSSGTLFYEKTIAVLPTLTDKKKALRIIYDVEREVSRYLLAVTLINMAFGVVVAVVMALAGMPNPALWGVATGLLNFIPYIGGLTSLAMISVVAVLSFDQIAQAAIPPLLFTACHVLEGQFITPVILGRRLELNSVAIFIALAFWSWLWGIVGAIIAVPILVCVKVFCDHFHGLAAFGEFLSAGPPRHDSEEIQSVSSDQASPAAKSSL
jgi:predicted PurR-regulated permease PerM